MWVVYCVFHTDTGKVYVGKGSSAQERWKDHLKKSLNPKTHFHYALRFYGKEAFVLSTVQAFASESDTLAAETYWISYWNSSDPRFGYNMTLGGDGVRPNDYVRLKMSLAQQQRYFKEDRETSLLRGRKISESNRGKIPWNKGHGRRIVGFHSEASKEKMRIQRLGSLNPSAKLIIEDVRNIRKLLLTHMMKEIAVMFNVSYSTIKNIKNGVKWKEII